MSILSDMTMSTIGLHDMVPSLGWVVRGLASVECHIKGYFLLFYLIARGCMEGPQSRIACAWDVFYHVGR